MNKTKLELYSDRIDIVLAQHNIGGRVTCGVVSPRSVQFTLATIAHADKVKALVLVEPAGVGDMYQAAKLKDIPSLSIYGDYIASDARWPTIRANNIKFHDAIRAAGGKPDLVNLPDIGIAGNSHMMMMDRNNQQIAQVIQKWLSDKGFVR